jgi:hypothetical protein
MAQREVRQRMVHVSILVGATFSVATAAQELALHRDIRDGWRVRWRPPSDQRGELSGHPKHWAS